MAITLTAGVDAGTSNFPVTGAAPAIARPFFAVIDAEQVEVLAASTDAWLVRRGRNGTAAVLHATSAVLTPLYLVETTSTPQTSPAVLAQPVLQGMVVTLEAAFVAAGAGVYTALFPIPAGATVRDVVVRNTVVWDSATSAALIIGDDDIVNGYIASTNMKTTPAADTSGGEAGLSTQLSLGATAGVYKGGGGKYCAAAKTITATLTAVGAGSAGRSRVLVVYTLPVAVAVVQV